MVIQDQNYGYKYDQMILYDIHKWKKSISKTRHNTLKCWHWTSLKGPVRVSLTSAGFWLFQFQRIPRMKMVPPNESFNLSFISKIGRTKVNEHAACLKVLNHLIDLKWTVHEATLFIDVFCETWFISEVIIWTLCIVHPPHSSNKLTW